MTAVLDGVAVVGIADNEVERVLGGTTKIAAEISGMPTPPHSTSVSPPCRRRSRSPPAGVAVFAGGIGGVRGAAESGDVSHDLLAIARHPVVPCRWGPRPSSTCRAPSRSSRPRRSGRRLEHRPVPGLLHPDSGLPVTMTVRSGDEVAALVAANAELGHPGGVLVANPIPEADELDPDRINTAIAALARRRRRVCRALA